MKKRFRKAVAVLVAFVIISVVIPLGLTSVSAAYNYLFPVNNGGVIAFGYGYSESYGGTHNGIDIHSSDDDTIYAAYDGVVEAIANSCPHVSIWPTKCEHYNTFGNYIRIGNADGTKAYYGHLKQNTILVSVGQSVKRGQPIAMMGSSGYSSGKHLHFELRMGDYRTTINTNPSSNGGAMNYVYSGYGGYNDTSAPTISNARAENISGSSFDIKCDLWDDTSVTRVWLNIYGPSGQNGYAVAASNGSFSHTIRTSDYGGAGGYTVHIYAFDASGNETSCAVNGIQAYSDTTNPNITNARAENISGNSFDIKCDLWDDTGVTRVWLNIYGPSGQNGYAVAALNGSFSHKINTADYGGAGGYTVHIYAFDASGNETSCAVNGIQAYDDSSNPTITNARAENISGSSFDIKCDLYDDIGVTRVWLNIYGPSGQNGYAVAASNGSFSHTIRTSDYGGAGEYTVHIYAFDASGNETPCAVNGIQAYDDKSNPVITNARAENICGSSFDIKCDLYDNTGVTRVWLNIYGPSGQNGYTVAASNGSFSHTIRTSDYGGAGEYVVHIYAFDAYGNETPCAVNSIQAFNDTVAPMISNARAENISGNSFMIKCNLSDNIGVTRVWLNIYGPNLQNGYAISATNGSFSHTINTADYGGSGVYYIHIYAFDAAGNETPCAINNIKAFDNDIGDTNLDGKITISDVTTIQRYLAEIENFTNEQQVLADTNGDCEINIDDATYLQMYLAEYDVVLGKQ